MRRGVKIGVRKSGRVAEFEMKNENLYLEFCIERPVLGSPGHGHGSDPVIRWGPQTPCGMDVTGVYRPHAKFARIKMPGRIHLPMIKRS